MAKRLARADLPSGTRLKKLTSQGTFRLAGLTYRVGGCYGFHQVLIITDDNTITVANLDGEILIEHTRPEPGITYLGTGRPPGPAPKADPPSPMS